jgi:hypothetical protein
MTHFELCKVTAEWAVKKGAVAFYEYQSFATYEFPDCLVYDSYGQTTLFEIKVDRTDFLRDTKKECRIKTVVKKKEVYRWQMLLNAEKEHKILYHNGVPFDNYVRDKFPKVLSAEEKEFPHLGKWRYYVCPEGLISPDEVGAWGLYWYRGGKFYLKRESLVFKNNKLLESKLLIHALRNEKNTGKNDRVIAKAY